MFLYIHEPRDEFKVAGSVPFHVLHLSEFILYSVVDDAFVLYRRYIGYQQQSTCVGVDLVKI